MSHGLLDILKYFLLALLWLFFLYAARMVFVDVKRARSAEGPRADSARGRRANRESPLHLRVLEPPERRGKSFEITDELTVGRSAACIVALENDNFASSVHARIYQRNGDLWVEDLNSTNGTYVNSRRLTSPARLHRGDRVKVGSTLLEVRH